MKSIAFYIFLSFIFLFENTNGQQTCLQNGYFTDACDTSVGGCPTWTDNCGAGWVRSHGTPQMKFYEGFKRTGFYAYMWAYQYSSSYRKGEGMFTSYSFMAHHTYDIKMLISTSNVSGGTVYVYAANSLTQHAIDDCGDPTPNISQKQLIGTYSGFTNGWQSVSFMGFIPNMNYSQIWIYPEETVTGVQYDLGVMYITACPSCLGTIIYNNGTVPSGETMAGYIYAGSSAGTGGVPIVTVQTSQATSLIAVSEVNLLPEFNANVTNSGSFLADILPCSSIPSGGITQASIDSVSDVTISISDEEIPLKSFKKVESENKNQSQPSSEIQIYPNPAYSKVNVDFYSRKAGTIKIRVLNNVGAIIKEINSSSIRAGLKHIEVDTGNLPNGTYLIQVIDDTGKIGVKKIQKLR